MYCLYNLMINLLSATYYNYQNFRNEFSFARILAIIRDVTAGIGFSIGFDRFKIATAETQWS
jgi:hypothetical protein